eukprot:s99_g35.t1
MKVPHRAIDLCSRHMSGPPGAPPSGRQELRLEDFLGEWRDSMGNKVDVEWARNASRGQLEVLLSKKGQVLAICSCQPMAQMAAWHGWLCRRKELVAASPRSPSCASSSSDESLPPQRVWADVRRRALIRSVAATILALIAIFLPIAQPAGHIICKEEELPAEDAILASFFSILCHVFFWFNKLMGFTIIKTHLAMLERAFERPLGTRFLDYLLVLFGVSIVVSTVSFVGSSSLSQVHELIGIVMVIEVSVVLSCIALAVLMTRAFCLAHRYAKMEAGQEKRPAENELALKAVHFSKRMRWETPLNLLLVATAFALHVFWLFQLNRHEPNHMHTIQEMAFLSAAILSLANCARYSSLLSLAEFNLPQKKQGIFRQMSEAIFGSFSNESLEDIDQWKTGHHSWDEKTHELAHRAVTLRALLEFYSSLPAKMPHFDPARHKTSDIVRQVIIPMSRQSPFGDCAAATVLMGGREILPDRMVTHSWSNHFAHLVASVVADALELPSYESVLGRLEAQEMLALKSELYWKKKLDTAYWICCFSINQHAGICGYVPPDLQDPVTHALPKACSCQHPKHWSDSEPLKEGQSVNCEMNKFDNMMDCIFSLNPECSQLIAVDIEFNLFTRAWCVAEIHQAQQMHMPQRMIIFSEENLKREEVWLHHLKVQEMKASNPADVKFILSKIDDPRQFDADLQQLIFGTGGLVQACHMGFERVSLLGAVAQKGFDRRKFPARAVQEVPRQYLDRARLEGHRRDIIRLNVKQLGPGRFACGHYQLELFGHVWSSGEEQPLQDSVGRPVQKQTIRVGALKIKGPLSVTAFIRDSQLAPQDAQRAPRRLWPLAIVALPCLWLSMFAQRTFCSPRLSARGRLAVSAALQSKANLKLIQAQAAAGHKMKDLGQSLLQTKFEAKALDGSAVVTFDGMQNLRQEDAVSKAGTATALAEELLKALQDGHDQSLQGSEDQVWSLYQNYPELMQAPLTQIGAGNTAQEQWLGQDLWANVTKTNETMKLAEDAFRRLRALAGGWQPVMVETERRRFSGEAGEARRRSATTEGCRRGRSPRRFESSSSSRVSKTKTLLSQLERQKVRLRQEFKGWRNLLLGYVEYLAIVGCLSRLQADGDRSCHGKPELVALEPIMDEGGDGNSSHRQQYRAHLQLQQDLGLHTWSTEPFTLDELLRIVVRTRAASATRWCLADKAKWQSILHAETRTVSNLLWTFSSFALCAAKALVFWSSLCWGTWLLATLLRPSVDRGLQHLAKTFEVDTPIAQAFAPFDLLTLLTLFLAMGIMALGTLLTAGGRCLTEVSFLPAKAILSLEHKAESEKVREQLAILLRGDCVRNLDICNFLSLGMATYFNSSETHKEGRCFVRRHETAEEYFTKRRRQHCSI